MIVLKKMWSVLAIMLALGLGVGCELDTSPDNTNGDNSSNGEPKPGDTDGDNSGNGEPKPGDTDGDNDIAAYSYNVDEITGGLFGNMSPTMTMNEWCVKVLWPSRTYDALVQGGDVIYKDKNLKTPFTGSDILNENTVVYCDFPLNGQGKKTGEITGTITLNDISDPTTTKVYINSSSISGYPNNWWNIYRKIDMSGVTGTSATFDWSLPVYESFKPPSQATFNVIVLPGDSLNSYTVSVPTPTRKTIDDVNANIGDLGTVSIRGVTLSGTLNVTYNGQPVPYVEIYANYPVQGTLNITCLSLPGPDAPWSVTFGIDANSNKEMEFKVYGCSKKNWTIDDILFDRTLADPLVYIVNNQSMSGIVLNVGDITGD